MVAEGGRREDTKTHKHTHENSRTYRTHACTLGAILVHHESPRLRLLRFPSFLWPTNLLRFMSCNGGASSSFGSRRHHLPLASGRVHDAVDDGESVEHGDDVRGHFQRSFVVFLLLLLPLLPRLPCSLRRSLRRVCVTETRARATTTIATIDRCCRKSQLIFGSLDGRLAPPRTNARQSQPPEQQQRRQQDSQGQLTNNSRCMYVSCIPGTTDGQTASQTARQTGGLSDEYTYIWAGQPSTTFAPHLVAGSEAPTRNKRADQLELKHEQVFCAAEYGATEPLIIIIATSATATACTAIGAAAAVITGKASCSRARENQHFRCPHTVNMSQHRVHCGDVHDSMREVHRRPWVVPGNVIRRAQHLPCRRHAAVAKQAAESNSVNTWDFSCCCCCFIRVGLSLIHI